MATFVIEGGHKLNGNITPQGAKNEALQVICAVLLTSEPVTISNIPDIRDVNKLIFILGKLGVKIDKINSDTYTFQDNDIDLKYLESEKFKNDGEVGYPGKTLLSLLKHEGLESHGIIVVRYFGGKKLGPGGVSRAFKECGKMLL